MLVGLVGLVACGALQAPAPAATIPGATTAPTTPPAQRDLAVAEPWTPPPEASPPSRDGISLAPARSREAIILMNEGRLQRPQLLEEKRSDLWDPCVRDVLSHRAAEDRNALGDALTGYAITCERAEGRIRFEPPQGRSQAPQTVIGLRGEIAGERVEVELRVVYWIARADAFERITILAGPLKWTSPRLDVDHDAARYEATAIPFAPSLARVVRRMLDEPDARVRFETASGYDEVLVTEQTKQDMRVLLDALNL